MLKSEICILMFALNLFSFSVASDLKSQLTKLSWYKDGSSLWLHLTQCFMVVGTFVGFTWIIILCSSSATLVDMAFNRSFALFRSQEPYSQLRSITCLQVTSYERIQSSRSEVSISYIELYTELVEGETPQQSRILFCKRFNRIIGSIYVDTVLQSSKVSIPYNYPTFKDTFSKAIASHLRLQPLHRQQLPQKTTKPRLVHEIHQLCRLFVLHIHLILTSIYLSGTHYREQQSVTVQRTACPSSLLNSSRTPILFYRNNPKRFIENTC